MIPELGHFALILAICFAFLQASLPLLGIKLNHEKLIASAKTYALAQAFFIGISFFALMYAFINNDFSVAYVANNSNTNLPLGYRLAALWGSHEGSLLLWISAFALWMSAVAIFNKQLPEKFTSCVLAILSLISLGFLIFLLMYSNPFVRWLPNFPTQGQDLNPLLQDIGMAIHPPMLYMGYVGFAVSFAFAVTALLLGKLDHLWARWCLPWTVAAWAFLTYGITLGSWWAYRVLGWGGFWFWDPVENASFMPWLTGTALIHSLMVTEKRGAMKSWTVLLAILAFSLSLVGTFIVRSGVLTSVHAFAVDPARGAYILKYLCIVIGSALFLYAWRAQVIKSQENFSIISRETFLLLNNVILIVVMATVLLGTVYPLIIEALGLSKISVGAPYFNTVFVPLMIPFIFLMGVAPHCYWQRMSLHDLVKRLRWSFLLSVLCSVALPFIFAGELSLGVFLGLLLAFWIICNTLQVLFSKSNKSSIKRYSMTLAHLGMAVSIIGITLSTAYSTEYDGLLSVGELVENKPYQYKFLNLTQSNGSNWQGVTAWIQITKNHQLIGILKPQQRFYPAPQTTISKIAIKIGLWRDYYVALGQPLNNKWTIRIYDKPFVRWIWIGGLLMLFGGILGVLQRISKKS